MKKIFICVALAVTVLNVTLTSIGTGRLSQIELNIDGIENMAEGEENVVFPWWPSIAVGLILIGTEKAYDYFTGENWTKWKKEKVCINGVIYIQKKECVPATLKDDEGCSKGDVVNFNPPKRVYSEWMYNY